MKPFNLEEAKAGKPVVTRDGRPVRILCFDRKNLKWPIVALVPSVAMEGEELAIHNTSEGRYLLGSDRREHPLDLMMKSVKKEAWINLWRAEDGEICTGGSKIYTSKEEAEYYGKGYEDYIGVSRVEWEE